jgi:GNAT superfamily N-acetyltransferase
VDANRVEVNFSHVSAQCESLKAYTRLMAIGSESAWLYEGDGITASVCPAAPDQPMANVVTYSPFGSLLDGLAGVERAYRAAGVRAWQVWTEDPALWKEMGRRGYSYTGHMPGMSMDLAALRGEPLVSGYRRRRDLSGLGWVNEAAYGVQRGPGLTAALREKVGDTVRVFEAGTRAGRPDAVVCVMTSEGGEEAFPFFLAVHPRAKGSRLGRRLLVTVMLDARQLGRTTAHLQASKVGAPLYREIGFEDVSPSLFNVYERRVGA